MRYGRYTLVSTQPDAGQRDLMAQIIDVTIPSSMNPRTRDPDLGKVVLYQLSYSRVTTYCPFGRNRTFDA